MKRRLYYTQMAETSLAEIAIYIAEASASRPTAEKFIARLCDKCRQLASLPGTLGTARPELYAGLRSIPHLGYVIFFRYHYDAVGIVNILHDHRDIHHYFDHK